MPTFLQARKAWKAMESYGKQMTYILVFGPILESEYVFGG